MNDFRVVSAGDAALLVEFADRIDPMINATALALAEKIGAANCGSRSSGMPPR